MSNQTPFEHLSALQTFARMLGFAPHQAEEALHSERAAKAVMSRRSFFAASAALATGTVLVDVPVQLRRAWVAPALGYARSPLLFTVAAYFSAHQT